MKIYTRCNNCKKDISIRTWYPTRVELKKNKGDSLSIECKYCKKRDNYEVESFKARESKSSQLIALLIFILGTPLLFLFTWDFFFKSTNVYLIAGILLPLLIPSIIYGIITKNDQQRVSSFNRS